MKSAQKKIVIKRPKLVVYDFDGVMTNNRVIVMEDGSEGVIVNRSDGLAVSILKECGVPQVIMSTEKNRVVAARAKKLSIPVIRGISDKKACLIKYCLEKKILLKEVVYVGNDLNDLEVMQGVGYAVCPSDACKEVRFIADIILDTAGGNGVIQELLSYIKTGKRDKIAKR